MSGNRPQLARDEQALAEIWQDVLGVDQVGRHDNFFELGGDSLSAARVIEAARSRLQRDFALGDVFERPTIAELAAGALASLPGLPVGATYGRTPSRDVYVRPSLRQEQLLDLIKAAPQMGTHRPVPIVFRVEGAPSSSQLESALRQVVDRHDVLRTSFELRDGEWLARVNAARETTVPFTVVDADGFDEPELEREIERESFSPPSPDSRCLIRGTYYERSSESDLFLLVADHLVIDGGSMPILANELGAFYSGLELPDLPIQFYDFAHAQRRALTDGLLADSLDYWREQMERYGPWPTISLPTLRARERDEPTVPATAKLLVQKAHATAFADACQRLGISIYAGYLAAACVALERVGGSQGPGLGVDIISACRSWPGTAELVGFLSDYATVGIGELPGSFAEAAGVVQEAVARSLRHDIVPRNEIMKRFSMVGGASLPRRPNLLFEKIPDTTKWDVPLADGRLVYASTVQAKNRIRRYPGLLLMVRAQDGGALRIECEYGVGEFEPAVADEYVSAWNDVLAAASTVGSSTAVA